MQSAGALVDGYLVVVEDDEDVGLEPSGVVEPFESKTSRQGAVSDDGDVLGLRAEAGVSDSQSQGG